MRPTDVARLRRGVLRPTHYRAAARMLVGTDRPLALLRRYVDAGAGAYPWTVRLRTPTGPVSLRLGHPHDVRTVNEVFFRRDYGTLTGARAARVVVDVGANIGVSAAYFLSRRDDCVVHCWEPVPANLTLLRANLAPYGDRAVIHPRALAPHAGTAEFRVEGVGRYSGLAEFYEHHLLTTSLTVECDAIADALTEVSRTHGSVDLLKVDTEGSEDALLAALPDEVLAAVGEVVWEQHGTVRRTSGRALVEQGRTGTAP